MPAFAFVGPAYEAANPLQDAQRLINWYPEIDPNPEAKAAIALLGAPGLVSVVQGAPSPVRGMWPLPGGDHAAVVIGSSAYLFDGVGLTQIGTLGTSSGPVAIRDNGSGHVVAFADGANIYAYSLTGATWNTVGQAAGYVAFIDGWLTFNQPGSQKFLTSPLYWNGTDAFDGTYFALKDAASDNLVALIENNRELWLIGERTTEIWFDAGNQYFPYSRLQGAMLEIGCAAPATVCKTGKGLMWLARSQRGENVVIRTQDYQFDPGATTPAISYQFAQYAVVNDAFAYVYTEEGHEFYVITFPTADATWVLDLTTGMWHQRASFDPDTGVFHRHRSNCCMNFKDAIYVGDYENGTIWQMTRQAFSDGPDPLVAVRRAPHVWDQGERNRVRNTWLQVEFTPGVGLTDGQGSDPQIMMRMSSDGGFTWGNEHWTGIGKTGEFQNRAVFKRLGMARDRVYEVRISDQVRRDVVGATLRGMGTRS
jgi:hypothetical protein